jgi:hypothetical protein
VGAQTRDLPAISVSLRAKLSDGDDTTVLGLTHGELFLVIFITVAVVSAAWWPRAGAAVAGLLWGRKARSDADPPP